MVYDYKKPNDSKFYRRTLDAFGENFDLGNFGHWNWVFEKHQLARNESSYQPIKVNNELEYINTSSAYVYADSQNSSDTIKVRFATDIANTRPGTYKREVLVIMDFEDPPPNEDQGKPGDFK